MLITFQIDYIIVGINPFSPFIPCPFGPYPYSCPSFHRNQEVSYPFHHEQKYSLVHFYKILLVKNIYKVQF
jgi:hypothetical protein